MTFTTKTWTPDGGARYLRERHRRRLDEIARLVRVQRAIHEGDPDALKSASATAPNGHAVVDQRHLYRLIAPALEDSRLRVTVHLMHDAATSALTLTLAAHDEYGFKPLPDIDRQAWLVCIFNGQHTAVETIPPTPVTDPARQPIGIDHQWTFRLPVQGR